MLRAVAEALGSDEKRLVSLRADYPRCARTSRTLGRIAGWAAGAGRGMRVTYELEDG